MVCRLDTHDTVFQAEVRAILECTQAMLEGDCRKKPVVNCSESQAALVALNGLLYLLVDQGFVIILVRVGFEGRKLGSSP